MNKKPFEVEKNELIKKLTDIHESVKNNKYRINHEVYAKYGLGYYDMLSDMNDVFNAIRKLYAGQDTDCQLAKLNLEFYHDFQSDINISRSWLYWINEGDPLDDKGFATIYEREENIERVIGYIHLFLETGRFDSYCFWYRGEYVRMDWDEERNTYFPGKIVKHYREEGDHLSLEDIQQDFEKSDKERE